MIRISLRQVAPGSPRSGTTSPLGGCRRLARVQAKVGNVSVEVSAKLDVTARQVLVLLVDGSDEPADILHHDVGGMRGGLSDVAL